MIAATGTAAAAAATTTTSTTKIGCKPVDIEMLWPL